MAELIGADLAKQVRDVSLALYKAAAEYALTRGIIIADTKFEFGLDEAGKLVWIDEALTPDSSRFWPADQYQPGSNPPSFDKQFVRDWLEASGWNKQAPGPAAARRNRRQDQREVPRGDDAAVGVTFSTKTRTKAVCGTDSVSRFTSASHSGNPPPPSPFRLRAR